MNDATAPAIPAAPIPTGISEQSLAALGIGDKSVFGDVSVLRVPAGFIVTILSFARIGANAGDPPFAMAQSSVFVPL